MRYIQHPSNNRVLGAPKDWDQYEMPCSAMPITDCDLGGVRCIATFWQPTDEDRKKIIAGESIVLIFAGTRTMPPTIVGVESDYTWPISTRG